MEFELQFKKQEISIYLRILIYVWALCVVIMVLWVERDLRTLDPAIFAYSDATDHMFKAVLYGSIVGVNLGTLIFGLYSAAKYIYDKSE